MHDFRHRSTPPHTTHTMGSTSGGPQSEGPTPGSSPSGGGDRRGPQQRGPGPDTRGPGTPGGDDPAPRGPKSGDPSEGHGAQLRFATLAVALPVLASALVVGDVWSTVAGLVLAIAGIVLGIVSLVRSRGSSPRVLITVLAVLAIVWGLLNAVGGGTRLLVWPATQVYQQCTATALTLSSANRCEQQLNDNVWKHFSGAPLETGVAQRSQAPATPTSDTSTPGPSASATPTASRSDTATPPPARPAP